MKENKGISLIVLIITIIIMIIISGAIILTLTQANIIDQAENAVNKYNETELKQRVGLVFTEAQMAKYTDLEYSIEDNLKAIFEGIYGKDNIIVAKSGKNYKVNVKDSKTTFRIKPDATIQEYEEMDPTSIYARLDDEGVLYLRATEKEGYNLYTKYTSIQSNWNTAGDATTSSVTKIVIEEEIAPTSLNSAFCFANLVEIENMQNLHTENVTDMYGVFYGAKNLKSVDLTNFDTSMVKTMYYMFRGCENLEYLNLSSFDTTNVNNMSGLFQACYAIESIDLSSFNTSNVTTMSVMFTDCRKLTNVDVTNFDTENVTNMNGMFGNCHSLTKLDISNFDTNIVTNMNQMFSGNKRLKIIKLGKEFVINDVTDLTKILYKIPTDIKITATEATRDKLISASSLTVDNFEIIK